MTDLPRSKWETLLERAHPQTFFNVVGELEDTNYLDAEADAEEVVVEGLDSGDLEEADTGGAFNVLQLTGSTDSGDSDDEREDANTDDGGGIPEAARTGGSTHDTNEDDSVDKYRRIYLDAVERAGREPWEYVEEDSLREALDAHGFAELLDNGALFEVRPWRLINVSDGDEAAARRWYYPSGDEPRPDEFVRFHELLVEAAPDNYQPHYFRVARGSKDPATQYGSWKTDEARLSVDEAVEWMENGGNVGIAGRPDDALINVDIDDDEETTPEDVPSSLRARSRSRTGWHTWYFDESNEIPNIPTDEYGEVRTNWQYVVAPGSFVASTAEEIPSGADNAGYYTVEDAVPVALIGYDDLPEVFREAAETAQERAETEAEDGDDNTASTFDPSAARDHSAVFDVEAEQLVSSRRDPSERFSSIFHGSGTGANMSVSDDGKLHCWRHGVAHGGLQALAALSDVEHINCGCKEIGAAHKNSGAGRNKLKGDWRLVWAAWHEAKTRGVIPDDDPIPYRALVNLTVEDGVVDRCELVKRDADTGEIADEDGDGETYTALPPGTYNDALAHIHDEYGLNPGRKAVKGPASRDIQCPEAVGGETWGDHEESDENIETGRDLLELDAVVEPANALGAASAVEPDDLSKQLPELEYEGVDDVAVSVALAEGMIDDPSEFPSDGDYTDAYYRARDHYGAPLPKYLDNSTLEHRTDLVYAALERIKPRHVLEGCRSEVTVEDPSGKAIAKLDPTWEDSESGERIVAGYGRGFYCVEHETSFSPIQLVALEHGLIDSEDTYPRGEAFKQAYTLLREEYGAPIPKWRATLLEHVAVLPPAQRVLDGGIGLGNRSREDAHKATEELIRDAVDVRDRAQLITVVPGAGKTYSTAIVADETPVLYLASRNDLKSQMEAYAEEIGDDGEIDAAPTTQHLPILAENQLNEGAIHAGVRAVRKQGGQLLRDRDQLLAEVEAQVEEEADGGDDETVALDRATCPTAEGEHGEEWRVAVQVARGLGVKPADIHRYDTVLFGDEIPCQDDGSECEYKQGWDNVRDPDNQADILIGGPGHAFVGSATTYFTRDENGDRVETPRAVVIDEFPGDTFATSYSARSMDHATWLAEALVDIDNREDLLAADLDSDTWVNLWLDGEGDKYARTDDLVELLQAGTSLADARDEAEELLDSGTLETVSVKTTANVDTLQEAIEAVSEGGVHDLGETIGVLDSALNTVEVAADRAYAEGSNTAGELYVVAEGVENIITSLASADQAVPEGEGLADAAEAVAADLPVGGDLATLLGDAVAGLRADEIPEKILEGAITALRGGREGCRELAVYGDDGYAHPSAWGLLAGAIADVETGSASEVQTQAFAFDMEADEGGTFKRLKKNGATIAADKNHHGTLVVDTPAFTDITGAKCPVLGLDATGRPELWRLAIGRDTQRRDIHETDAERREFLRDNGLRVVQTTDRPLPYHGKPDGKNFGEDLELVKTVAEKYTGNVADAVDSKGPAVISTLKVLNHLEDELEEYAGETINYENMKGSDALGEHQVSVVLGSCHYSDSEPEKWALLAGQDAGRGDTKGDTLDYRSPVANAYLKHMREDHTMQAILRSGRNDEDTVVFAHTSALRGDLPVEDEGVVLSAHSKGTLAVAEAAAEFTDRGFTAREIADVLADDHERAIGLRQVQNVLADLRESGYLRVTKEGGPGVGYEYELDEDPGLADVDLPSVKSATSDSSEKSRMEEQYTWNFVSTGSETGSAGVIVPSSPVIPAGEIADPAETGPPPT